MLRLAFVGDIHADADVDDTCEERDTRGEMSSVYLQAENIILAGR